jgi:hypothetical protein
MKVFPEIAEAASQQYPAWGSGRKPANGPSVEHVWEGAGGLQEDLEFNS